MNNFLFVHQCNREHYIITGLIESHEEAKSLLSVLCLVGLLQGEKKKRRGEKKKREPKTGKKKKLGGLILQTARQTLVTWAKEGQLPCIPDEVETSASGENKRELYVAPV